MKKLILLFLFALAGCTSINSTSFKNMSGSYRELVEQYNNENILINVVRSSKNLPVSFLDIPSVLGSGGVTPTVGAGIVALASNPSSVSGYFTPAPYGSSYPLGSTFNASASMMVNNSFTFTQQSLDNSTFMRSFLTPFGLDALEFHGTEEHLSRGVFYTLLVERIEIKSEESGRTVSFNNNPLKKDYTRFQTFLEMLLDAGLQVEKVPYKIQNGPLIPENEVAKIPAWNSNTMSFEKVQSGGKTYYATYRTGVSSRMCVNRYAAQELFGDRLSSSMYCANSPKWVIKKNQYQKELEHFDAQYGASKNFTLEFKTRSLGNVFNYLGNVMAEESRPNGRIVTIKTKYFDHVHSHNLSERIALFSVKKNESVSNPIMSITFRGDQYAIEDEDITYTKPVVEFISMLITLCKTQPATPSPTPSFLVR